MQLDEYDKAILKLLQQNALLPYKEISKEIHLSTTAVFERIKQMEKEGIIIGYHAAIDVKKIESYMTVFCMISLKDNSEKFVGDFIQNMNNIKEVFECFAVTGDIDFLVKARVRDMADYEIFYNKKLLANPNILKVTSLFTIKEIKDTPGQALV